MVKNMEDGPKLIENWLRSKNTLEYLAAWETIHNSANFNSPEFEGIRKDAGSNRFLMSVTQWVSRTHAVGIMSKAGRYGGTEAHADIAFHFAMWISPVFQLLVVKEFQLLKQREALGHDQHWDMRRFISKANYRIQTDAIKVNIIPLRNLPKDKEGIVYAEEAEVLNVALFGTSSKDWRLQNPQLALHGNNLRDYANTHQLIVMANLESLNAELIKSKIPQADRLKILRNAAISQLNSLRASPLPETLLIESPNVKALPEKKSEFDTKLKGILAAGKPPKDSKK